MERKKNAFPYLKKAVVISVMAFVFTAFIFASSGFKSDNRSLSKDDNNPKSDSTISKEAFLKVYAVLESPRCMNCHPSGESPLQGDRSTVHTMQVKRGTDGKGVLALKCANCHMNENTPGLDMPPGNPNWRLPPENMKMVFQGRTPRQLAAQLLNPKMNGGKTKAQLIDHVTNDSLVRGSWHEGEGRTQPPMAHDEFAKAFKTWIDKGAYLPD